MEFLIKRDKKTARAPFGTQAARKLIAWNIIKICNSFSCSNYSITTYATKLKSF